MQENNNKYLIGVDVGGMSIKIGIVTFSGTLIKKSVITTSLEDEPTTVAENIYNECINLITSLNVERSNVYGIGFGFPGIVNPEKGEVTFCANLPKFTKVNFSKIFKKFWNIPIAINNDANAAAYAETKFGVARNIKNIVLVTLGTGIGTGFIVDGKMLIGTNGAGAEGGHICIKVNGKKCGCGRKGCWEQYASATALMEQATEYANKHQDSVLYKELKENNKLTGKLIIDAAKLGDKGANLVINKYTQYVSTGLANLVNIFRPELIVIGGGISNAGSFITDKIYNKTKLQICGRQFNKCAKIVPASLGNDAGIIGAAAPLI